MMKVSLFGFFTRGRSLGRTVGRCTLAWLSITLLSQLTLGPGSSSVGSPSWLSTRPAGAQEKTAEKPADKAGDAEASKSPEFTAAQIEFFEKEVQPILKSRCLKCHGGEEKIRSGFRMTSRGAILRGGELGAAISLTDPDSSAFLKAIRYEELEMPPSGRLPAAEVATLTRWVREKMPWTPGMERDEPVPHKGPRGGVVDDEARKYWAYQPLHRPQPPAVTDRQWGEQPIDAFLLAAIENAGLKPVGPADPVALIRRAYYDLTGLPPSPEAVAAFVADHSPAAYERLIDQLLDSPHYGEKWGRHWLDLVRYAETNGYERDNPKPEAWRYRDYVISAFQQDKPYDRFILEQLAGDELDDVTIDSLVATGYYRLGIWDDEPADRLLHKFDVLDGVVSTTAQVFMGMSIGCARCHEHKRDPLPHRDYYRMLAFFRDVSDMNGRNLRKITSAAQLAELQKIQAEKSASEGRVYGKLYSLEQQFLALRAKEAGGNLGELPASDLDDVRFRFYRDTWERLPDFDALKHETEGTIALGFLSLSPASRQEAIGMVWEAKLKVPQAGKYTFDVDSTEGVRVKVGEKVVIDRPEKGRQQATSDVELPAGIVSLRVDYFNTYAKPSFRLGWTAAGGVRRSLTDEAVSAAPRVLLADSREQPQKWSYTTTKPGDNWNKPDFDASQWATGPGGFGTRGTPGAVVRTEWKTSDIWLRTKIMVDRVPSGVALNLHHDEDVQVFMNGQLIYEAKGFLKEYERVVANDAARGALRVGENTIAVHCRQTGGGQYVDVGLVEARAALDVAREIRERGPQLAGFGPQKAALHAELAQQLAQLREQKLPDAGTEVMSVQEAGRAETHVLLRGNPHVPGEKVVAGVPAVFTADPNATLEPASLSPERAKESSGKRLAFAKWLVDPDNPLTARVFANRLWQYHFGRGIVASSNDFGRLGDQPTNPALLDWLASELRDGGWRVKRMHKLIMTSRAYQLSAQAEPTALAKDPANNLHWRYPMRRLTAEELRDSILWVSGQLSTKAGGPSVYPPIPREVLAGQSRPGSGWGKATDEEAARRTVYVHVKRSLLVPLLADHDAADTDSSCPVRYATTVPTQALGMLNGEFTNEQAKLLAQRLKREVPNDLAGQVRRAIRLATAREATAAEVQDDLAFIEDLQKRFELSADAALVQYCLLTINSNAFVYLD